MGNGYASARHYTFYAILLAGLDGFVYQGFLLGTLVLQGTVYLQVGTRHGRETLSAGKVNRIEIDRGHVIRVILHIELLPRMQPAPFQVWFSVLEHLPCILLFFHLDSDPLVGKRCRLVVHNPEHINHVYCCYNRRLFIYAAFIYFHSAFTIDGVLHGVPLLPCFGVDSFQFVQCRQALLIGFHAFKVGPAAGFLCGDVLTREVVILVENLLLEASEYGLNRFGRSVVGHCCTVDMAYFVQEAFSI